VQNRGCARVGKGKRGYRIEGIDDSKRKSGIRGSCEYREDEHRGKAKKAMRIKIMINLLINDCFCK
jgi:hypothetical protein